MSNERRSLRQFIVTVGLALILMLLVVVPMVQAQGIPKQFLEWAVIKKLTVQSGGATFQSDVTLSGSNTDLTVGGDATVTGDLTAGTLTGSGTVTATDLVATDDLSVGDDATITGDVSAANVTASTTITGADLVATDDLTVGDDATITGDATAATLTTSGDVTVSSDSTGGNAGARSQIVGMPAIKMIGLGTMTNGSTESVNYLDDSPTGEWSEVDGGTNITVTADSAIYRVGSTSLQIEFSSVVTDEGVTGTAGAQDDLSGNESIGFWVYTDDAIQAGDFELTIDDSDGTDQSYDLGAISADAWHWVELDVSGCNSNCDTMDNILVLATAQGAANHTTMNLHLDGMWKWDADDEEALGVNLVQDGVLSVLASTTTTTTTMTALTEQTNFIVNYQSGNDVTVTVDDESANSGIALVAYQ